MQEHRSSRSTWTETLRTEHPAETDNISHPNHVGGAMFDTQSALSDMKKLQDPAKFGKARFSFRLYKK